MDHPVNDKKLEETKISTGVQERLNNAEKFLGLTPVSKDVYERIQQIENRIFYLETVSPEYNHFLVRFGIFFFKIKTVKIYIHLLGCNTKKC